MSYTSSTDFLALLRQTNNGVRLLEMPGLDYLIAALSRAGLFRLWVSQDAPTTNQTTTAWLRPALPSWSAEGTFFLWSADLGQYQVATPALWNALFTQVASQYVFQSVNTGIATINPDTTLLAVQRSNPSSTVLTLPTISTRFGRPLRIVDYSTSVANHLISLVPVEPSATIMQKNPWQLFSTADQLSGITLYPSTDLNAWVITP